MNTEKVNPHLTAKIVVSYVRHRRLVPDQLADLIASVHRAIGQVGPRHGLSQDEYRQRWGLRNSHPLTAPAYSESRSTMAKASGFGRKLAAPVAPAKIAKASPAGLDAAKNAKAKLTRRSSRPASKSNVASKVTAPTPATKRPSRARVGAPAG